MTRLKEFLAAQSGLEVAEIDARLSRELETHAGGEPFADDRTLVMIRRLQA
jgi:hypothetical protein